MTETTRLTRNEMAVLQAAMDSRNQNYQPSEDWLPTANRLYERGLLEARADFPDCTIVTDAGVDAYYAELEAIERDEYETGTQRL